MVYVISRGISATYLVLAAGPAHRSGYADIATAWDGGWYHSIATFGYPASLPLNADGQIGPNAWAFSPLYPLSVRAIMTVTGLDFALVAPTLSLVLGAGAMVVLFRLLEHAVGRFYACACVILSGTFMAAPAMQIAYAESLALLLLVSTLLLLRKRRYAWVAALLLVLALTRPVLLAFVPVIAAHAVSRWRRRDFDPFPVRDRWDVGLLTGWCFACTALWPIFVGVSTGDMFAWTKTFDAWRTGPRFRPGIGWPASFLHNFGWLALGMLTLVVLLTTAMVLRTGAKAWGPELRAWSLAYPAYLFLVTTPGPSVIRWLTLLFPLMWPFPDTPATSTERRFRMVLIAVMAGVGLVMQWVWVTTFLGAIAPSTLFP